MCQQTPLLIVPEDPGSETIKAHVLRVFDGDGFMARILTRDNRIPDNRAAVEVPVRLGFIDAPENEQPGGPEAKAFLAHLIGGATLDLAILLKMDTGSSFDRHGRIVCVPYLTQEYPSIDCWTASNALHRTHRFGKPQRITRNVELEMVVNGWAWVLDRYEPDERYTLGLENAQRHRRGIWANDDNIPPWDFKRQKHRRQRRQAPSAQGIKPSLPVI
jgi:micrococcal nuclease